MILDSPFVEGFIGLLEGVAVMFGILLAIILFFAVIFALKSAGEWVINATLTHPVHAVGVALLLVVAFVLATGLWTVPSVQAAMGAFTAFILLTVVGLVVVVKVIE